MVHVLLIALGLGLTAPVAAAQDPDDVDYLELATVLVRDGHHDRASGVLGSVDLEDENLDKARYYLLRGLVRLHLSRFGQAAEDFETSIAERERQVADDPDQELDRIVYVHLGQAFFYSEQFEEALGALDLAGERGEAIAKTYAMRAEANRELERYDEAWAALGEGMKRHPEYHELVRRRAFLAIELQLYQTAAVTGQDYLSRVEATPRDYLNIGIALNRSGNQDEALKFLELARLRFPTSMAVAAELARLYEGKQMYRTAALMLERASLGGAEELTVKAAELYRQAGEPFRALALNGRVRDSKARIRQRLGILLDLRRYELVAIMDTDLKRVGLLRDEPLRYALAYAHFKTGNYARADQLLSGIEDPGIFREATELRKAMSDCREERWGC